MKYTLYGFSQAKAIELGIDDRDLMILRWFVDYKDTDKMVTKIINEKPFYWIKYEGIQEAFPIAGWKKDTIYRRLKKMVAAEILEHETVKNKGTYSFYSLGNKYLSLLDTSHEKLSEKNPTGNEEYSDLNPTAIGNKSRTKDSSINNKSINICASEIWSAYPKKKGKATAIKKIEVLLRKHSKEEILTWIDRYKLEFKNNDYTYMAHGSTFFNSTYEDYKDDNYTESNTTNKVMEDRIYE